jgi:uncharacterized protein YecE (DUF72 family)
MTSTAHTESSARTPNAARAMHIGPAGWSYPDWDGRVYPAHKPHGFHPLAFLARSFDCIEVNSSFYALPRAEHAQRWCELVHDHARFRFIVKLLQDFTHTTTRTTEERASELEALATEFLRGIEPLVRAKRLSALLVQFPVTFLFGRTEVRRLGHLRALFSDVPIVLEVRHQSWFTPPALATIRGLSCSLAYIDLPAAWNHPPLWHEPTGPIGYLRLHGRNASTWFRKEAGRDEKYDYLYSQSELDVLATRARRIESASEQSFAITNNHFGGKAVANAIELAWLMRGEPVPASAEIVASFPELAPITHIEGQQRLF